MIYIDLDGVLADLEAYMISKDPQAAEYEVDFFKLAASDKRFFLDSPVIHENLKLLEYRPFRILSSLPCMAKFIRVSKELGFSHNKIQKCYELWSENKMKFCEGLGIKRCDVILVNSPKDKLRYCNLGDTLFDDRFDTIRKWSSAGGKGILVPYKSRRKECSD